VSKKIEEKLKGAVDRFFDLVSEDPLLDLYFAGVDLASLKSKFCKYLSCALADNLEGYDGPSMYEAHAGRGITDEAVDRFLARFKEALRGAELSEADIERVHAKIAPVKDVAVDVFVFPGTIVYKPESAKNTR
jgi:hemoglobin